MTNREKVFDNEILRGIVGSTAHGTAIEGQDDRDEMGIFIEPPEYVCGLTSLDHYIYRDQPDGVRSQPGDLDLTMYSLRKFCKLAEAGNPSILMLLWLPEYITKKAIGSALIGIRQSFISKAAGKKYLGYLRGQRASLTGEVKKQDSTSSSRIYAKVRAKKVNRPELIEKYGYDTKFAMQALRLGYQGIELLKTRNLTLPVAEPHLNTLREVRTGVYPYELVLKLIEMAELELKYEVDRYMLEADRDLINKVMVDAHKLHWG